MDNKEGDSKPLNPLTSSILYLHKPFAHPINEQLLQQALSSLSTIYKYPQVLPQLFNCFISRYNQLLKLFEQIEQYLLIKFVKQLAKLLKTVKLVKEQQQMYIVIIWTSVGIIRNCVSKRKDKQRKQLIGQVIETLGIAIQKFIQVQKGQTIYPQVSAILMQLITNSYQSNHKIFSLSISIISQLLCKIFNQKFPNPHTHLTSLSKSLYANSTIPNISISPTSNPNNIQFDSKCLQNLQQFLKLMISKSVNLDIFNKQQMNNFIKSIWFIGQRYTTVISSLAILAIICCDDFTQQMQKLSNFNKSIIRNSLTHKFIQLPYEKTQQSKTQILLQLQKLSKYIKINDQNEINNLIKLLCNYLYIVQNRKSLIIPYLTSGATLVLQQLTKQHNFANYGVGLSSLMQGFIFECDRILIQKLPYIENSLTNIQILKQIAEEFSCDVIEEIIKKLVQQISVQQNNYIIDMSLTKFSQFLTKILLIFWLLRNKGYTLSTSLALNLFDIIISNQGLRILKPTFNEEYLLISFCQSICYTCYQVLVGSSFSNVKKLQIKLSLLEFVISNVSEDNFMIKSISYHILLVLAAPGNIGDMLMNLHTTLINRNINNLELMESILKLSNLESAQSEDLANRFMHDPNNSPLLNILLPALKTQTVRKCLLAVGGIQWVRMLGGNCRLLHGKKIEEEQGKEGTDNFYMNNGDNVMISNALGVVLLQFGQRWQYTLSIDSRYRQITIDLLLEIAGIDVGMVFFKARFVGILECLMRILDQENKNQKSGRLTSKIYKLLNILPQENYKIYKIKIAEDPSTSKSLLNNLLSFIQTKHKSYQLSYLNNSDNKDITLMYDISCSLLDKIGGVNNEEVANDQRNDENTSGSV